MILQLERDIAHKSMLDSLGLAKHEDVLPVAIEKPRKFRGGDQEQGENASVEGADIEPMEIDGTVGESEQ